MQAVYRLVAQCAPTNSTVLLTGESGTGKELIARAIHYNSLRKDKPFVAVDCNSLSENLLESELFGHVKGAFTGAVANKKGMFEVAGSGTPVPRRNRQFLACRSRPSCCACCRSGSSGRSAIPARRPPISG